MLLSLNHHLNVGEGLSNGEMSPRLSVVQPKTLTADPTRLLALNTAPAGLWGQRSAAVKKVQKLSYII